MRNRTHTGAAVAVALALSSPILADERVTGTWHGTWPTSRVYVELTVTDVDEDGSAHGLYCNVYRTHLSWWDLHPDQVNATVDRRGRLKFRFGDVRWEYRPQKRDHDTLRLIWRKSNRRHTLDMQRVDPGEAACRTRIATLDDPDSGLTVDLSLFAIEDGHAKGVFCNAWTVNAMYFYALDPREGFQATTSPDTVRFDVGNVAFDFQMENATLHMTRTAGANTRTLTLEKTNQPTCAPRFIPAPAPET